jgi:hypothetical protein
MNKAIEIWNSLDLSNQTNLECARAWFIEGFAHGETLKELTDAEIWSISAKHGDLSWHDHTLNFARAILKEAQKK